MKTPTNIGGNDLATWLQTATEIRMADLYTITLKNGTALRYTTWDTNLVVLGNKFLTGPPNIARSAIEEKLGMDVATLEITIEASLTDTINGSADSASDRPGALRRRRFPNRSPVHGLKLEPDWHGREVFRLCWPSR